MDTRVLQYFLAIAEEGNMTRAAKLLYVTRPTLSKQISKLEKSMDVELFHRTSRQMILTEAGLLLRDRAKVIIELTEKTMTDLQNSEHEVHGTIKMSVAESDAFREIVKIFTVINDTYPKIQFDVHSGDASDVTERLDKGLIDFGLLVGNPSLEKYNVLKLDIYDEWGILLRKDDPLAEVDAFNPDMLTDLPLILSRQAVSTNELSGWLGSPMEDMNILATYNLINNAAIMAEEGFGYLVSLDCLVNTTETGKLVFRPLDPPIKAPLHLIWRRNQNLSAAADVFLTTIRNHLRE